MATTPQWTAIQSEAIKHLTAVDPVMARLIQRAGPVTLTPRRLAPYQSLVHAIIYQQISGKAASAILSRLVALFPGAPFPQPEQLLALPADQLRHAGLSRQKVIYLHDIAQKAMDQLLPTLEECDALTDEQLYERLIQIKGVGRWTIQMLLIFNLGRPDILPVHDLGIRKGYKLAYRKRALPTPAQLEHYGKRWRPFRTIAAWYLWRATDSQNLGSW